MEVPVNEVYQTYHPIVSAYDKYLDTPSQMPWQWYQSNQKIYGYDWWGNCKNDGIFGADYGSWWSPDDDYTGKNSYSAWGAAKSGFPAATKRATITLGREALSPTLHSVPVFGDYPLRHV